MTRGFVGNFYLIYGSDLVFIRLVTYFFIFIHLKRKLENNKNKTSIHISHCAKLLVFVHKCLQWACFFWPPAASPTASFLTLSPSCYCSRHVASLLLCKYSRYTLISGLSFSTLLLNTFYSQPEQTDPLEKLFHQFSSR